MSNSKSYEIVRDGILEIHRLFLNGDKNSPAVKAIRDATDEPWTNLSEEEQDVIQGLSVDLYEFSGVKRKNKGLTPQQAGALILDASQARDSGDYDTALKLLRDCQEYSSDARGAYLRGTIWQRKGDLKTASVFFKRAVDLEPKNANFRAIWLHVLKRSSPELARTEAEAVLSKSGDFGFPAVIYACEIAYFQACRAGDAEAQATCRRLIPILEDAVRKMRDYKPSPARSLFSMAISLLAMCHEHLQEAGQAYDYYSECIRLDPKNPILYVARGKLLYGENDEAAAADFDQAVRLKCTVAWPYFFLSHYLLGVGRFEDARKVADAGGELPSNLRVKSELLEFKAIAEAQLKFPDHIVRRTFEEAIRTDITNERATRNLEVYEELIGKKQAREWERPSPSVAKQSVPEVIQMSLPVAA